MTLVSEYKEVVVNELHGKDHGHPGTEAVSVCVEQLSGAQINVGLQKLIAHLKAAKVPLEKTEWYAVSGDTGEVLSQELFIGVKWSTE